MQCPGFTHLLLPYCNATDPDIYSVCTAFPTSDCDTVPINIVRHGNLICVINDPEFVQLRAHLLWVACERIDYEARKHIAPWVYVGVVAAVYSIIAIGIWLSSS